MKYVPNPKLNKLQRQMYYAQSLEKWSRFANMTENEMVAEQDSIGTVMGTKCGFCYTFTYGKIHCGNCPLDKNHCTIPNVKSAHEAADFGNYHNFIKYSRRVARAIVHFRYTFNID